jgi:hypothetical protein
LSIGNAPCNLPGACHPERSEGSAFHVEATLAVGKWHGDSMGQMFRKLGMTRKPEI